RSVWIASFTGLMICATGTGAALALPATAPITSVAATLSPPSLLPVGHHGHHRHWRHGHGRWSRAAPLYGPAPETNAAEPPAPVPGYAPSAGSSQPPATTTNRDGGGSVPTTPNRRSE